MHTHIHVFVYTADASNARPFAHLQETRFELTAEALLVAADIDKGQAQLFPEEAGLAIPAVAQ